MPVIGVTFYFSKSPRYIPPQIIQAKIISIIILTIILPILLFYLLKTLKKVKSIYLKTTKERIIPLVVNCFILLLIIRKIFPQNDVLELYYFFIGALITSLSCLMLSALKFKASIHMAAVSGILMFFIALSIHFSININGTLALLAIIIGSIATSRLHLKAHNYKELIIGFFVGLIPQLITLNYWL
jgi:hypothetical protein